MKIGPHEFDETRVIAMDSQWKRDVGATIMLRFEDGKALEHVAQNEEEASQILTGSQIIAKSGSVLNCISRSAAVLSRSGR